MTKHTIDIEQLHALDNVNFLYIIQTEIKPNESKYSYSKYIIITNKLKF